jgi:hypothetical protein
VLVAGEQADLADRRPIFDQTWVHDGGGTAAAWGGNTGSTPRRFGRVRAVGSHGLLAGGTAGGDPRRTARLDPAKRSRSTRDLPRTI